MPVFPLRFTWLPKLKIYFLLANLIKFVKLRVQANLIKSVKLRVQANLIKFVKLRVQANLIKSVKLRVQANLIKSVKLRVQAHPSCVLHSFQIRGVGGGGVFSPNSCKNFTTFVQELWSIRPCITLCIEACSPAVDL